MTKNYGTNNPDAWGSTCYNGQKHDWKIIEEDRRGRKRYKCQSCGSVTVVDSGN